jgi:membrane-bound serine protease (ClpP class)
VTIDGGIDPIMERYVDRTLDEAEDTSARAVVLRIDTPGGLVSSMEDIVKRINASDVPVITYVWPSGGHAASAGTFITLAGHVAAMAPATRIGAASPVSGTGEDIDSTLEDKITEDLAALIRGIAAERGRNVEWAEDAVREAVSANEDEAVELNVVDFEARTLDSVLQQADGRTVRVGESNREVTLSLLDAPLVYNNRTPVERFLGLLADPNIAFLLLSLGALALLIEIFNPGMFVPGIVGAISLLLAFLALGTLPVNWAGVALIMLAFALFLAEMYVTGFGALGIGGVIALIFGGLILTSSSDPDLQVDRWLIFVLAAVVAGFFFSIATAIMRTRRAPAHMGAQALVGRFAVARTALDPEGFVFFDGARWRAEAEQAPVPAGERVRITAVKGLRLTVRRDDPELDTKEGE